VLPLDKVVFNTEAHAFPYFEMGKLFKTGWERKSRGREQEEEKEDKKRTRTSTTAPATTTTKEGEMGGLEGDKTTKENLRIQTVVLADGAAHKVEGTA